MTLLFVLTNEEFKQRFPNRQPIDVQEGVEKPYLYILGQSKLSDKDQMAYTDIRLEDLSNIDQPTIQSGVQIFERVRVFSGDGPARQFEDGQQRGGHYSCLCGIKVTEHQNLECARLCKKECICLRQGFFGNSFPHRIFLLSQISKKDYLIEELEARDMDTFHLSKQEMQGELAKILHETQRPPALLQ